MDSLLNQRQAAKILGLSKRTLERHRQAGMGPRYAELGRLVRYRECDLAEWVQDSLRTSTSQSLGTAGQKPTNPRRSAIERH
jgi:predicted DNA-binding transcriptional regulator AlpA